MARRDSQRYMLCDDGLIVEKVGSWAEVKLKIVKDYVYAAGARAASIPGGTPANPGGQAPKDDPGADKSRRNWPRISLS